MVGILINLFVFMSLCEGGVFGDAVSWNSGEVLLDDSSYAKFLEYMRPVKPSFEEKKFDFCEFRGGDGDVLGWCFEVNEIGKELPITFLVCASQDEKILYIKVLKYRETRGGEIRSRLFLKQFRGKTPDDPIKVGKDIKNIRGATLSAWATTRAVRKTFALIKLIKEGKVKIIKEEEEKEIKGKKVKDETSLERKKLKRTFLVADSFVSIVLKAPYKKAESKKEKNGKENIISVFSEIERFLRDIESDFVNYYRYGKETLRISELVSKYSGVGGGYFNIFWRDISGFGGGYGGESHGLRKKADLSGIWKGYVVDELREFIERKGVSIDELNFGNSTFFFSDKVVDVRGRLMRLRNLSLSVSSTSAQYSRIFDPVSGDFVNEWREAVVIHPSAEYSDFASTLCVVAGEKCMNLLDENTIVIYSHRR